MTPCTSSLVRKHWAEPVNCRRCDLAPVLVKIAGLAGGTFIVRSLRWECWHCGRRGPKAGTHQEAAQRWNERQK